MRARVGWGRGGGEAVGERRNGKKRRSWWGGGGEAGGGDQAVDVFVVHLVVAGVFPVEVNIHAVQGGIVYCLAAKGTPRQFLIYGAGNLFGLLSLLLIRIFGKDRIRENVLLTLLFALCTQLFMQMGRACVSALSGAAFEAGIHFITTDALSGLFTMVIVWIASRLDGVFEDQISYLLRVQKEAEEEKGGFS